MRWILILLIIIVAVVIVQNQRNSCEWFQDEWIDCLMGETAGSAPATDATPTADPDSEPDPSP